MNVRPEDLIGAWELIEVAALPDILADRDPQVFAQQQPGWLSTPSIDEDTVTWTPAEQMFDGFRGAALEIDALQRFREVIGGGVWGLLLEDDRHAGRIPTATGVLEATDDAAWLIREGSTQRQRRTADADLPLTDLIRLDAARPGHLLRVKSAIADDGYALQRVVLRYEPVQELRTREGEALTAEVTAQTGRRVEHLLPAELVERLDRTHQAAFAAVPEAVAIEEHDIMELDVDPSRRSMSLMGGWRLIDADDGFVASHRWKDLLVRPLGPQLRVDARTRDSVLDWVVATFADDAVPDDIGRAAWEVFAHRPRGGALRMLVITGRDAWALKNSENSSELRTAIRENLRAGS